MTVLHSYEEATNGFMGAFFVMLLCTAIIFALCTIATINERDWGWAIGFAIVTLISAVGVQVTFNKTSEIHTEYEVIIHDYNEVYEKGYEIVEERGDITVVKRIEEADE